MFNSDVAPATSAVGHHLDDGTRVLASRRAEHTALLRAELDAAGKEYVTIGGGYPTRFDTSVREIERLLRRQS